MLAAKGLRKLISSSRAGFKGHLANLGNVPGKRTRHRPSTAEQLAHRALVEKRAQLAMWVGTAAFTLNTLEPWLALHDFVAVKVQLASALALAGIAGLSHTAWGARHRLTLFTCGFLIAIAGFHQRAVNLSYAAGYSAGFPIFFAFHCVFIPVSVLRSALAGLAALAIVTIPDVWVTGRTDVLRNILVSNSAAFVVLLYWRHVANRAWENEFCARERERELMSMISAHEIRTPLSTLCLISEELEAGHIDDEGEQRNHYRALAEESRRLRRVMQSLLEFTQMEAEAPEYAVETIDLVDFTRLVGREFEHDFSSRGYRVEVQVSDERLLIPANATAIRSVLWNLLDNAMKYSPACHMVWVSICKDEVGNATIRVQDHGLGIPRAELSDIFKKFVRGETAKKMAIRGTGVGLAIVRHIVEAHRGEIHVESKPGEGSTFTVLLPAIQ